MAAIVLIVPLVLAACGGDDEPAATAVVIEKEVIKEVPVEKVVVQEKQVVVVATPVPVGEQKFLIKTLDAFPKYGGSLKLASHGPPAHFDLYVSLTIANAFPQSGMYDRLVRRDLRDTARPPVIPDLTHSWEISSDGKTYTLFLREGAKWHDGTDFGAEDVKASYDRIIFPPAGILSARKASFGAITNVNVVDDFTIEFKLGEPRPAAFMMAAFASGWNIIHQKEALEANGGDMKRADDAPGTGPYRYDERTSESWKVVKNQDFWNPNVPYVDDVEYIWLGAGSTQLSAAVLAGLVDFGMFLPPATYKEVLGRSNMSGLKWTFDAPNSSIGFNLQKPPFNDARVRNAVHLATDKFAHSAILNEFGNNRLGSWYPEGTIWPSPKSCFLRSLATIPLEEKRPSQRPSG